MKSIQLSKKMLQFITFITFFYIFQTLHYIKDQSIYYLKSGSKVYSMIEEWTYFIFIVNTQIQDFLLILSWNILCFISTAWQSNQKWKLQNCYQTFRLIPPFSQFSKSIFQKIQNLGQKQQIAIAEIECTRDILILFNSKQYTMAIFKT